MNYSLNFINCPVYFPPYYCGIFKYLEATFNDISVLDDEEYLSMAPLEIIHCLLLCLQQGIVKIKDWEGNKETPFKSVGKFFYNLLIKVKCQEIAFSTDMGLLDPKKILPPPYKQMIDLCVQFGLPPTENELHACI